MKDILPAKVVTRKKKVHVPSLEHALSFCLISNYLY